MTEDGKREAGISEIVGLGRKGEIWLVGGRKRSHEGVIFLFLFAYVIFLLYLCSRKGFVKERENETNYQSMAWDVGL